MKNLNRQFKKAVRSPFHSLSVEDLKPIALGFWHEGYKPELSNFDLKELRKAGYLIDRFRGYNCVPQQHKRELGSLAREIEKSLSEVFQGVGTVENIEPLAEKWNLTEDVSHLMSSLLEYQTRHYVHARSNYD